MRRGPGRPSECPVDADNALVSQWLGPGNTNVAGGWVVPGIAPSRYTQVCTSPQALQARVRALRTPAPRQHHRACCTYDRFRPVIGDPRGVIRTGYGQYPRSTALPHCSSLPLQLGTGSCSWVLVPEAGYWFLRLGTGSWYWFWSPGTGSWYWFWSPGTGS